MDQNPVPTTVRTLANDYSLVKEAWDTLVALYPFTLCDKEGFVAALALRLLLPQMCPVRPGKAKDALRRPALTALTPDHAFEITLPRTGMMLNGHLKGDHSAGITAEQPEGVMITRVTVGVNAPSGIRFKI